MSKKADWGLSRAKHDKNDYIIWMWHINLAALSVLLREDEKGGDEQGDRDRRREAGAGADGGAHVGSTQQIQCVYLGSVSCLHLGCPV